MVQGWMTDSYDHGNGLLGSMKGGQYVDWLSDLEVSEAQNPYKAVCESQIVSIKDIWDCAIINIKSGGKEGGHGIT